jgi:hypothetical protein
MTKEALKLALVALETDWGTAKAITAIKEALAQPEQEPVAWVNLDDLYDLEAGEDGDVPYVVRGNEQPKNMPKSIPLYTTPQPAQKPLTDEQIERIWESLPFCNGAWETFARAIEAAHGIKENT